jgi:phenylalanyl-tRNA synthetase beta chain
MLFSGLEAIVHNQNRQNADLRFFEQGYTYRPKGEEFKEEEFLSLFITGRREAESWHHPKKAPMTYYTLKGYVEQLMNRIGTGNYQTTVLNGDENTASDTLAYGLRYHRGPQVIVEFGKVKPHLVSGMDIKQDVFYAAFRVKSLLGVAKKNKIDFIELTKYPRVRRDLALVIGKNVKFDDITGIARKTGKKILKDVNLFDVYENEDQLGKDKKSYAVSFTFEDPNRTLNDKEIDKVMQRLIATYEGELGAVIRR